MKKYYTPNIDILALYAKDIIASSKTIREADENSNGFDDHGSLDNVFSL